MRNRKREFENKKPKKNNLNSDSNFGKLDFNNFIALITKRIDLINSIFLIAIFIFVLF